MMNKRSILTLTLIAALLGLLPGCVLPGTNTAPTAFPPELFPTVVVMTGRAAMATNLAGTPSVTPTETLAPTYTPTQTNTPTPTFTDTPTPSPSAPVAQIRIQVPGPMSKLTSPISLRMQIVSGRSELVQIDLQGEDGRLLARNLQQVKRWPGGYVLSLKISFEIQTAAELGRITIITKDEYGRVEAQSGMHVLLLSVGDPEINREGEPAERAVIYKPAKKDAVATEGILTVEGRYLPINDQQVVLELIDPEGTVVGLRVLDINGTEEQSFSTTVPYKVFEQVPARLVLRQNDDRMNGLIYLYSQEVSLLP